MERPEEFATFEAIVKSQGRGWRWLLSTAGGEIVMCGSESCRAKAKYQAARALFQMLSSVANRRLR